MVQPSKWETFCNWVVKPLQQPPEKKARALATSIAVGIFTAWVPHLVYGSYRLGCHLLKERQPTLSINQRTADWRNKYGNQSALLDRLILYLIESFEKDLDWNAIKNEHVYRASSGAEVKNEMIHALLQSDFAKLPQGLTDRISKMSVPDKRVLYADVLKFCLNNIHDKCQLSSAVRQRLVTHFAEILQHSQFKGDVESLKKSLGIHKLLNTKDYTFQVIESILREAANKPEPPPST